MEPLAPTIVAKLVKIILAELEIVRRREAVRKAEARASQPDDLDAEAPALSAATGKHDMAA